MTEAKTKNSANLHPYQDSTPEFEEFLPFVHLNDEAVRPAFTAALRRLYKATADTWRPGGCRSILYLDRAARELRKAEEMAGVDAKIMTYSAGTHYFLGMTLPGELSSLIVDPFGVPAVGEREWMTDQRLITPFFGSIEQAPPEHQHVYQQAREGYRAPFHM